MGLLSGVTNLLFGSSGGGGVAASAPSSSNVTQTSIPEYARPYVEKTLGQAAALTDINANPYQTYGGQRIQAFTPMQEQAFQNYANQQVAGQLGAGTGLAAAAGLGAMGAGADYARMATDPRSIQSYMSPYMQNVVDLQKQEAVRDYTKGLGALGARASAAGAFGGTRAALERAEAGRNLNSQLANIQAQGTQNAFNAAQQAQQFGANIGLQGYGQGLQAASTLGQLGQTQFGQQQAISDALSRAGAVQQAQGQQALDLAYQDFTQQKNYPYQQLAFMSDMYRGLPLSQAAQQQYTAGPSALSQLGGLGTTALGIYGMSGGFKPTAKEGGAVKGYKNGGSIGYLSGGDVKEMTTEQLKQLLRSPNLNPLEVEMIQEALMVRQRMESNPQADEMMSRSGIASIGTGDMVPEFTAADGGIIAFSTGGTGKEKRDDYKDWLESSTREMLTKIKDENQLQKADERLAKMEQAAKERAGLSPWAAVADFGAEWMRTGKLGDAAAKGLGTYGRGLAAEAQAEKDLLQQQVDMEKAKLARNTSLLSSMQTSLGHLYSKDAALEQTKALRDQTAATKGQGDLIKAQNTWNDALKDAKKDLRDRNKFSSTYRKNPDQFLIDAENEAKKNVSPEVLKILGLKPAAAETPAPAKPGATSPAPAAPASSSKLPKITTQEAYNQLKSGQQYVDPDGNVRTKK